MRAPRNAVAALLVLSPAAAHAGGLVLPGLGPVSTGRAGASVASVDDPAAIGINPAGLARIKGTVIHIGTSLIAYHQTVGRLGFYENTPDADLPWEGQRMGAVSDDSKPAIGLGPFQAVPVIAVASDIGGAVPGLVVAAGVFAPNAYPVRSMGADYDLEDPNTPPPPTRYDTLEQKAAVVAPSIALAYTPPILDKKLHIGGRFSFGFADVEARTYVWGLANYDEWAGRDGEFSVKVKDGFVPAWGLGAGYEVTPNIEVGLAYQSAVHVVAKGTGTSRTGSGNELMPGSPITVVPNTIDPKCAPVEEVAPMGTFNACVNLDIPQLATIGGRYIFRDADDRQVADIELNVQWENWGGTVKKDGAERAIGDYQVIVDAIAAIEVGPPPIGLSLQPTLIRHNLRDTFSVRLGGSYQRPVGANTLTLRAGVAHDTAAAKEGWQRADFDGAARWTMAAGASFGMKKVRVDVGAGMVYEGSRTQGTGCNPTRNGEGCGPGGAQLPLKDRVGPDPVQPTIDSGGQQESPFTTGVITSGYNLLMLGVTTWF